MTIVPVVVRENIAQSQVTSETMQLQIVIGKVQKMLTKEKIKRIQQKNSYFIEGKFSVISSLISKSSDSSSVILGDDCAL